MCDYAALNAALHKNEKKKKSCLSLRDTQMFQHWADYACVDLDKKNPDNILGHQNMFMKSITRKQWLDIAKAKRRCTSPNMIGGLWVHNERPSDLKRVHRGGGGAYAIWTNVQFPPVINSCQ